VRRDSAARGAPCGTKRILQRPFGYIYKAYFFYLFKINMYLGLKFEPLSSNGSKGVCKIKGHSMVFL